MFTAREKADEAQRELVLRERVYSRYVQEGRMSAGVSDRRIALMKQIRDDYRKIEESERLI